jgi:F-type H+-transporting ATPase subunit epsilon
MPLTVQVVTPEREVEVCDDATLVIAKGTEGEVGVMPGHAPLMIALALGGLTFVRPDRPDQILVDGGFLQVKDDNVIVLAEYAALPTETDAATLSAEEETLRHRLQQNAEDAEAQRDLLRTQAKRKLFHVG